MPILIAKTRVSFSKSGIRNIRIDIKLITSANILITKITGVRRNDWSIIESYLFSCAEVLFGLFDDGAKIAVITTVAEGLCGDNNLMPIIDEGIGVVALNGSMTRRHFC